MMLSLRTWVWVQRSTRRCRLPGESQPLCVIKRQDYCVACSFGGHISALAFAVGVHVVWWSHCIFDGECASRNISRAIKTRSSQNEPSKVLISICFSGQHLNLAFNSFKMRIGYAEMDPRRPYSSFPQKRMWNPMEVKRVGWDTAYGERGNPIAAASRLTISRLLTFRDTHLSRVSLFVCLPFF